MRKQVAIVLLSSFMLSLSSYANKVVKYHYWFDRERKSETVVSCDSECNLSISLNAGELEFGVHQLYYRVQDSIGLWSPLYCDFFFANSLPKNIEIAVNKVEYWFDNSWDKINEITLNSNQISFFIQTNELTDGLHTLYYRILDNEGRYSSTSSSLFLRNKLQDTILVDSVNSVEYWFDNNYSTMEVAELVNNTIDIKADASALCTGLHTLSFRVKDLFGNISYTHTWAFFKNEAKATRITWYKYWWNNNTDKATIVYTNAEQSNYVFEQELIVPDYARTDGYSTNSTARFNIIFCDDKGSISDVVWADVTYPDVIPPISTIKVDKEYSNESVLLSWSANEDNIQDYNIYYSENDQPFVLWLPNTTSKSVTFKGHKGKTYRFTVTARDKAGNRELLIEDKCVTVKFLDTY